MGLVSLDSPLGSYPKVQFQFPIYSVNTLMVPVIALYVAQIQVAKAKAPTLVGSREAKQPIGYMLIFRQ